MGGSSAKYQDGGIGEVCLKGEQMSRTLWVSFLLIINALRSQQRLENAVYFWVNSVLHGGIVADTTHKKTAPQFPKGRFNFQSGDGQAPQLIPRGQQKLHTLPGYSNLDALQFSSAFRRSISAKA